MSSPLRAARLPETRACRPGSRPPAAAPAQSAQIIVRGEVAALPLAGLIDLDTERSRLTKELAKLDQDIGVVEKKLGNPDFMARAPEEIVEENRDRKAAAEARKVKVAEALARLA